MPKRMRGGPLKGTQKNASNSRAELIEAALDVMGLRHADTQTRAVYARACGLACDAISEKAAAPQPTRSQVAQSLNEVKQLARKLASKLGSPNVGRAIDLTVAARDEQANDRATYDALSQLKDGLGDARQIISAIALASAAAPTRLALNGKGKSGPWDRFEVSAEVWAAWFCIEVVRIAQNLPLRPGKNNPAVTDAVPLIWEAATGKAGRHFERAVQTARLRNLRDPEDGSSPPQVAHISLRLEMRNLFEEAGVLYPTQ